jgi:hypothetical protein
VENENLSTTEMYHLPMGKFDFSWGLRKHIDFDGDDGNPDNHLAPFVVNPKLVLDEFTALLDDFEKLKKGAEEVDKFELPQK